MTVSARIRWIGLLLVLTGVLTGCMRDVDNEYRSSPRSVNGAAAGAVTGMIYSTATGTGFPGSTLAGAVVGGGIGYLGDTRTGSLFHLMNSGVQVIQYGDIVVLVFDSDTLFEPATSNIRYERYGNLIDAAAVLKAFKGGTVTIKAYADNVGNDDKVHELTQNQAQSLLSFFWSHGVRQQRMRAIGYGKSGTVASTAYSRGSAFNRRVEIHLRPSFV